MTSDTLYFVDSQGPSPSEFNIAIDRSFSGDDQSLIYILSLAKYTDGEGGLNYGDTLLNLKKAIGDTRFRKALMSLSLADQESVKIDMDAARGMREFMKKHS